MLLLVMLFEMLLHALGFGKDGACGFRVVARDIMRTGLVGHLETAILALCGRYGPVRTNFPVV